MNGTHSNIDRLRLEAIRIAGETDNVALLKGFIETWRKGNEIVGSTPEGKAITISDVIARADSAERSVAEGKGKTIAEVEQWLENKISNG